MIANPTAVPEKDKENIVTLGDTLGKALKDLPCII
jgi:hypothetical protein